MRDSLDRLLHVAPRSQVDCRHSCHGHLLSKRSGPGGVAWHHPPGHHAVTDYPAPLLRPDHVQLVTRSHLRLPDDERSLYTEAGLETLHCWLLHLHLRNLDLSLRLLHEPRARLDHPHHPGLLLPDSDPVGSDL